MGGIPRYSAHNHIRRRLWGHVSREPQPRRAGHLIVATVLPLVVLCSTVLASGSNAAAASESTESRMQRIAVTSSEVDLGGRVVIPPVNGLTSIWRQYGDGSPNVTVGIFDTGLNERDSAHLEISRQWVCAPTCRQERPPRSVASHGVMVANIVAGRVSGLEGAVSPAPVGVAPGVRVESFRIFGANGSLSPRGAANATRLAARRGIKVVNFSSAMYTRSHPLEQAIERARRVLFVVSAGNESSHVRKANPVYPCMSNQQNVICVGASSGAGKLANFSNYSSRYVDLLAPGINIPTRDSNGDVAFSGTSAAAPIVSGVAALIWSRWPRLTAAKVRRSIESTTRWTPRLARKVRTGGVLSMKAALKRAGNLGSSK